MLFANPYAWAGAVTLVGLAAAYLFRNRFRPRPVSSLMLWRQVVRPRQGGLRRDRLSLPPLFYLELAALAALVVAAAGPHVERPAAGSLTVVFDASASMEARGADGLSARQRALRELRREVARRRVARVRLLVARATGPELLGTAHPSRAAERLERVACGGADGLGRAVARAGELSEPEDLILVLTDRAPAEGLPDGSRLRWQAAGRPLENVALTYADRTWGAGGVETLLVEVTGFGLTRRKAEVAVRALGAGGGPLAVKAVELAEGLPARVRVELPAGAGDVEVALPEDALPADGRVRLVAQRPRPVAVEVRVADERLAACARRAAEASGRAVFGAAQPQLVFADAAAEAADAPFWQVVFGRAEGGVRLAGGPFLADRSHPFLEGVGLEGLVWTVGTNVLSGRGLAFAGSVPLLTLEASSRQPPRVRVLADTAGATFLRSAAWPVFVWNVLAACAEAQPGPSARNLRVGERAVFAVPKGESRAVFETPSGVRELPARGGRVAWSPTETGLYRMRGCGPDEGRFAVNLFAAEEADLRGCASGVWGGAEVGGGLARSYRSLAWAAGAGALVLALAHQSLLSRGAAGGGA